MRADQRIDGVTAQQADGRRDDFRQCCLGIGAQNTRAIDIAGETGSQHAHQQRVGEDETHRDDRADQNDPLRGRQQCGSDDQGECLKAHGDRHEDERMFAVFEGVECALDH